MMLSHKFRIGFIVVMAWLLQGCPAVVVGGVAATAKVAGDRRSVEQQMDDQATELDAAELIAKEEALNEASKINFYSNNGHLLMVGQTPTEAYKAKAASIARRAKGVRKFYNELRIGKPVDLGTRSSDSWITTKVRTEMLADNKFDGTKVKVVTENSEVFLIGVVTTKEGEMAAQIARRVDGVKRVIKVFEPAREQ